MVQLATRERVDAFWSSTLAVDAADLHIPGVRVYPNPPARNVWRGVYVLVFDKAATVLAPPELVPALTAAAGDLDAETVLDASTWHRVLEEDVYLIFGPVVHHYLDSADGLAELAIGRRINPRDAEDLTALRGAVSLEEWTSSGFTAQPSVLFGHFEDDELLAAANLTHGPDAATDVGIVLHPRGRGRGFGVGIAAAAARQAIALHGVARFRALASSAPTMAIATKLGFGEYGRNLAIYLSRAAAEESL